MKQQRALALAFKEFDKNSWLLMGLMFFVKVGFFMTIPYFSFYLYYRGYSPIEIGLVAAAGPLVASLLNIWSGFLTDKFGKKSAMVWAFIVFAIANTGIAWLDGFWVYFLLNVVLRLADSTFGGAMQAYMADNFSKETQRLVFHIRFMTINAAAAMGPIAGALFAESHTKILFDISAVISLLGAVILARYLAVEKKDTTALTEPLKLKMAMSTLIRDPSLLWITAAFFLYWLSYIQLDSTLAQILAHVFPKKAVFLFAMIWVINTVVIVIMQLPIAYLTRKLSYSILIWSSGLLLLSGFWVIANFLSMYGLAWGTFLITLGEILLSPLGNILIAQIASQEYRATYFGAFNLSFVGAGVAPIIGSFCLTFMSSQMLFMCVGGLFGLVIFLMKRAILPMELQRHVE